MPERVFGGVVEGDVFVAAAALAGVVAAGFFHHGVGFLEGRGGEDRDLIEVGILHAVIGGVVDAANEPGVGGNIDAALTQAFADVGTVGEVGEEAGVGTAAPAAAGPAIVRGFMRIVETCRAMTEDDDYRREVAHEADVVQRRENAVGGFFQRETARLATFADNGVFRNTQRRKARGRHGRQAIGHLPAYLQRQARSQDARNGLETREWPYQQ